ncbi:MAG TPA: hypothetical protein VJ850_01075 [Candidatus Limnocylindrales bacterium]|nr:hypothetical protein [Candidatus Limnocylindrales bacterium]
MKRRQVLIAAFAVVVVAGGALFYRFGTNHVDLRGIAFDVPLGWNVNTNMPATTGPGQELAVIGTAPDACGWDDYNCRYQERLSRHEIQIDVSIGGMLSDGFCQFAKDRPDLAPRTDGVRVTETHYVRIDGRPSITVAYDIDNTEYRPADGQRQWMISAKDSVGAWYSIFAQWRGPGDADFIADLDRMVGSIKLGPSGYAVAGGADCGDPFPPAS